MDRVLERIRTLSHDLRPSGLDELGLAGAIGGHLTRIADHVPFNIEFVPEVTERRFAADVEIGCFRIFQEGLTNTMRHSQAKHVTIVLTSNEEALSLSVHDDGVGFDLAGKERSLADNLGFGLQAINEQASLAGGRAEIRSTPGKGFTVSVRFPSGRAPDGHRTTRSPASSDHG